jgi:hypothetical protein
MQKLALYNSNLKKIFLLSLVFFAILYLVNAYNQIDEYSFIQNISSLLYIAISIDYIFFKKSYAGLFPVVLLLLMFNKETSFLNYTAKSFGFYDIYKAYLRNIIIIGLSALSILNIYLNIIYNAKLTFLRSKYLKQILRDFFSLVALLAISQTPDIFNIRYNIVVAFEETLELIIPMLIWIYLEKYYKLSRDT